MSAYVTNDVWRSPPNRRAPQSFVLGLLSGLQVLSVLQVRATACSVRGGNSQWFPAQCFSHQYSCEPGASQLRCADCGAPGMAVRKIFCRKPVTDSPGASCETSRDPSKAQPRAALPHPSQEAQPGEWGWDGRTLFHLGVAVF